MSNELLCYKKKILSSIRPMWNDLHGILNENCHVGICIMCNHLYASILLMLIYEYILLFHAQNA